MQSTLDLPDAIRAIIRSYKTLLTHANGAVASYDSDVITGSKESTRKPRDFGSEADLVKRRVINLARLAEGQAIGALAGRFSPADRRRPDHKTARKVILKEAPGNPAELAYLYCVTESYVKEVWREAGLDPATGERIPGRPSMITEPAPETLRRRGLTGDA
jgi:hypothetical protein